VRVRARGGGETRFEMDGAETVLSARVSSDVRDRARRVADALQIEGFAAIDAFVNVDNGEMIVVDVDTVPPMTSASAAVFEQALAEDPPVDAETFCTRALSFALVRRFR
jgi:type II secretory pathway component PulK